MPEYLTPGVYVEEFEMGAKPIEGVSTSTVGFLGMTERGPVIPPKLVTSYPQFMRIYGGYIPDSYLAYAVEGFFGNGGKRCYIGRVVKQGVDPDNPEGISSTTDEVGDLNFTAVGEGSWGNRVGIRIENASNDSDDENDSGQKLFKLTVAYWSGNLPDISIPASSDPLALSNLLDRASRVEVFDNVSEDPNSPDHYLKKLGDPLNNLSNLILLDDSSTGRPDNTNAANFFDLLTNGAEAAGSPSREDFLGDPLAQAGEKCGLTAFNDIDEISILSAPDLHHITSPGDETLINDILTQCELLKDRFAILDVGDNSRDIPSIKITRPSKYGAIYYPWINVYDPLARQLKLTPPCGHVAGIYARTDTERGVHKAPANEVVKGASSLEFAVTKGEQAILNPRGVNVIRNFNGRGILVWGARNMIQDPLWKYINVRRLFIYVEESIEEGTQWVVFEPNDEKLWARVRATITQFLTRVWKDGALMGTKVEEAFFVKCDRSTMTQDDIDNGKLICIIGIAPVKPAEFVIFRIAQWASGSRVTE